MKRVKPKLRLCLCAENARLRRSLRKELEARGCHVTEAATADEAVAEIAAAAETEPFDGALLSLLESGGKTGLAVLGRVQKACAKTVVEVLVKDGQFDFARLALRGGASAFAFEADGPEEIWQRLVAAVAWQRLPGEKWCLPDFLQEGLEVGISIIDRSFCIRYANPYQLRISTEGVSVPGVCWVEYDKEPDRAEPCPWCPVRETFADSSVHTRITVSPKKDGPHFYDVTAVPIADEESGIVIAAAELVEDITESMLNDCRAAILKGEARFREAMEAMLKRMCDVGFDRARLYVQIRDPHYMDGIAAYGEHAGKIRELRLDLETDPCFDKTRDSQGVVRYPASQDKHRHLIGVNGQVIDWEIRPNKTDWLEAPLKAPLPNGEEFFVGKISLDNDPSSRPLERNKRFWWVLEQYTQMLAPIVAQAREQWMRQERSKRAESFRRLDDRLVSANTVREQMAAIVKCAMEVSKARQCHIRLLAGDKLVLMAHTSKAGRVRPEVYLEADRDTSVSVKLARSDDPGEPQIWDGQELNRHAERLRKCGLPEASEHFRRLRSCAVFGLMASGKLIGTLVIDAGIRHFFDSETIATAKELVYRAQTHMESNRRLDNATRRAQQVEGLLDSIPSQVATIDRTCHIRLTNEAWQTRVGGGNVREKHYQGYAEAARCVGSEKRVFEEAVRSVFAGGETELLVSEFAVLSGKATHMDVTIAPFEHDRKKRVDSVLVSLSDIGMHVAIEALPAEADLAADLAQSLERPVERIRELFEADAAGVVEFFGSEGHDPVLKVWNQADVSSGAPAAPELIGPIAGVADVVRRLEQQKYIAVARVVDAPEIPRGLREYLAKRRVRSLLTVPVYLGAEPWGALGIGYRCSRGFSGREVGILQAAATQISLLIVLSQQVELRNIDEEISREIGMLRDRRADAADVSGLLRKVLDQAVKLTGCDAGHIRTVDWFTDDVVLRVASDPLLEQDKPPVRERMALGEPVSGIVAQTWKPHICNDREADVYAPLLLKTIPRNRKDVFRFLNEGKSYACFPLIAGEELLGTFSIQANHKGGFSGMRQRALNDFSRRAALALYAARCLERMREMGRLVEDILRVDRLADLWPRIPEVAVRLFCAEDAAVSSYDHYTNRFRREVRFNPEPMRRGVDDIGAEAPPSDEPGCGLTLYVGKVGGILRLTGEEARRHPQLHREGRKLHKLLPSGEFNSIMLGAIDTPDGRRMGVLKVENRKGRPEGLGFTGFDEALMAWVSSKLAIAIERLQLLEARNRAIVSRTHDLKTPLHAVRSALKNLRDGTFLLPQDAERVDLALGSAKLLDAFILNTLDIAEGKIPADRLRPTDVDMAALAREATDVFAEYCREQSIRICFNMTSEMGPVYGDRHMLLRILLNLIDNARKYGLPPLKEESYEGVDRQLAQVLGEPSPPAGAKHTHKWGLVTPEEDDADPVDRKIDMSIGLDGPEVVLRVADNGKGIPKDFWNSAFDPYSRSEREARQGRGIGLAAVRMLAQAHGGNAEVGDRDGPGSGAVITVRWDQQRLRQEIPPEPEAGQ